MVVATGTSTRKIGFVPLQNVRRHFAAARFSPRPRRSRIVRRFSYEAEYNYETDNTNRLESREVQGDYRIEMQNSDVLSVEAFRNDEFLRQTLSLVSNVKVPAGTYGFSHLRTAVALGQQHRLSGVAAVDTGQFYDGTKQTFSLNARYGFTPQLGVEPNVSLNWVERTRSPSLHDARSRQITPSWRSALSDPAGVFVVLRLALLSENSRLRNSPRGSRRRTVSRRSP